MQIERFSVVAMMRIVTWLLFLCLLAPAVSLSQYKKIPVAVAHSGSDSVGVGFVFALKEAIRSSQSFFLVNDQTPPQKTRIFVHVTSVSIPISQADVISAIGIATVYQSSKMPPDGAYIGSDVRVCGRDRIEWCAKDFLPEMNRVVEILRSKAPDLWETLISG